MKPEYTAYSVSPHARVGCVKCHIGSGAEWFVKAKISGLYQVYAVLFDKVPRPIETPIKNLRPSRDTCEQCHWPAHFYNEKLVVHDYFGYEEDNTHWKLHLLMKIGGGGEDGPAKGIHWHMNINNTIEYVATDDKRLEIPWVKSTRIDGTAKIFRNVESISPTRTRPRYETPQDGLHRLPQPAHPSLQSAGPAGQPGHDPGPDQVDLPDIKWLLVGLMRKEYETTEEAMAAIEHRCEGTLHRRNPEILDSRAEDIQAAIEQAQRLFSTNIFPEMKVSWRHFPDHIGHLTTPGCFRCHDGLHETDDGEVLSRDCNVCHTIVAQERKTGEQLVSLDSVEYVHPEDIDGEWRETNCSECHGE